MVKPNWDTEELIEHWTLLPQELELVENKVGGNKIGFALLLKHFQIFASFPNHCSSIPKTVISYIASQLNVTESAYSDYDFKGRSARVYRAEIRSLFDFRVATVTDSEQMSDWLIQEILPNEQRFETILEIVSQKWRELQIEPPTTSQVERLIRSAIYQYEANFCQQTLEKLTPSIIQKIDILLSTEDTEETEDDKSASGSSKKFIMSDFAFLKTDPGAVGLNSFLTEIKKLKLIRAVDLPPDLFTGISEKLLKTYRNRASTESPYDLRRHKDSIRYTLMAAFCVQRAQEITDNLIEILTTIIKRIDNRAEKAFV
ncbi:MAG: DUF4158 domain-containing protein [Cyanobacteria bacterium J06649_11]